MPLMMGRTASLKAAVGGIITTDGGRLFQMLNGVWIEGILWNSRFIFVYSWL